MDEFGAPDTALDGPYQRAHEIEGMSTFDYWVHHDSRLNEAMVVQQKFFTHWLEWFPLNAEYLDGREEGGVFMVDVGGGYGHDLEAFATKNPGRRRLVLQDLPNVRDGIVGSEGEIIERMPHDFFSVQPIKGAEIYYMHKILHDWPDTNCVRVHERLRDAIGSSSKIFVNDYILPIQGCPRRPAVMDMAMLAMHSGNERDEEMWSRLVSKVGGLKIQKFWHCPGVNGDGIVEIVRSAES